MVSFGIFLCLFLTSWWYVRVILNHTYNFCISHLDLLSEHEGCLDVCFLSFCKLGSKPCDDMRWGIASGDCLRSKYRYTPTTTTTATILQLPGLCPDYPGEPV